MTANQSKRQAFEKALYELDQKQKRFERGEYNGISGCLPEWVPEPTREEFFRRSIRLQEKYSCKVLVDYLSVVRGKKGRGKTRGTRTRTHPVTREPVEFPTIEKEDPRLLIPQELINPLHWFAWLEKSVELGPSEGLRRIAGKDAELGRETREQRREFGKKAHVVRKHKWSKWITEAEQLKRQYPYLATNKSALARIIKKNLGLSESIRTICRRI